MNKKIFIKELLLVLATFIWGIAFVFQSIGMENVGPFTFNAIRSFIGALFLLVVLLFLSIYHSIKKTSPVLEDKKTLWIGGILCGLALCFAMSFQQLGIVYEGAGKAGFITALYIVLVPVFGIFLKRKITFNVAMAVVLSLIGLYLINNKGGFQISKGTLLLFLCAVAYSIQIMLLDYFAPKCNVIKLTAIEFFVAGILNTPIMIFVENPTVNGILNASIPLLYVGVCSSGIAFTLQSYAQKDLNPTIAAVIMSFESVFAILAGMLLLNEKYGLIEICGCICIFVSIILCQLPKFSFKKTIN